MRWIDIFLGLVTTYNVRAGCLPASALAQTPGKWRRWSRGATTRPLCTGAAQWRTVVLYSTGCHGAMTRASLAQGGWVAG